MSRQCRVVLGATLVLALAACDGETETGPFVPASIRIVSGATATDTVTSQLNQLLVEVLRVGGKPAAGVTVRFEAQPPTDAARNKEFAVNLCAVGTTFCALNEAALRTVTTNADGRAAVLVRLGTVAEVATVRITVPELSLQDSAKFTVRPGNATSLRRVGANIDLDIGVTQPLRAIALDQHNNVRNDVTTLSADAGVSLTVDATAGTITGREIGTQRVYLRVNALADTTTVRVLPPGRIVAWDPLSGNVSIMNLNGSNARVVVSDRLESRLGVFPRFDATRQRITLHRSSLTNSTPNVGIVVDTLGAQRREFGATLGFEAVLGERQYADGSVLLAGRRTTDGAGYWIFRIATDNTVTRITGLPGLTSEPEDYGGVDFSHDGTRVAYLAPLELRVVHIPTGATTVIDGNARSPRWSALDDRIAFLVPPARPFTPYDGSVAVINADGTGRRVLSADVFSPGMTWSPDGAYLLAVISGEIRLIRVSDGVNLTLQYKDANKFPISFIQPDWR